MEENNMKKVIAFTLVAVMALAMLVSCGGSKNDILGKWKGEEAGVEAVYEFKNDGTVEITAMGFTMTGTYKVEGDTLTMGIEMMGVNDSASIRLPFSTMKLLPSKKVATAPPKSNGPTRPLMMRNHWNVLAPRMLPSLFWNS